MLEDKKVVCKRNYNTNDGFKLTVNKAYVSTKVRDNYYIFEENMVGINYITFFDIPNFEYYFYTIDEYRNLKINELLHG